MTQFSKEIFEESVYDAFIEVMTTGDYEDVTAFIANLRDSGMHVLADMCDKEWRQSEVDRRDAYETLEYARI